MALSRRKLLKSAAAAGALSVSGVFAPAIAQNKPLRIGILAPRSGIAAAPGENGIRATQWAVERYNAKGGIAGRKVELVIEEEILPQGYHRALSASWCSRKRSIACTGIVSSGVGLALGPAVEEARALTIYWDGTTPGRRRRDDPEPAISVPLDRQRMRSDDGLAARDQALEGQVCQRSPASIRTILTAATTWRRSSPCSNASASSMKW